MKTPIISQNCKEILKYYIQRELIKKQTGKSMQMQWVNNDAHNQQKNSIVSNTDRNSSNRNSDCIYNQRASGSVENHNTHRQSPIF
jgi:hypothetical protein